MELPIKTGLHVDVSVIYAVRQFVFFISNRKCKHYNAPNIRSHKHRCRSGSKCQRNRTERKRAQIRRRWRCWPHSRWTHCSRSHRHSRRYCTVALGRLAAPRIRTPDTASSKLRAAGAAHSSRYAAAACHSARSAASVSHSPRSSRVRIDRCGCCAPNCGRYRSGGSKRKRM